MKTAAAYIRVSTEDQKEFSPDSQLKAIEKYASAHGILIPDEFIFADEGVSGRKADKRPGFQKMIAAAKSSPRPFDLILLWKFSRFARNREDSIVYKSLLRKECGIEVVSVSEQLSPDKTSILMEAIIEAMDEYYSLNLAEEVRRGMWEKFSRGGVVSQPPFGYKISNGEFVAHEINADIVKMIFNDFIAGTTPYHIAAKLNNMGISTSKGNPFESRTVQYILTNPVYTGKLRRSVNGKDPGDRYHEDRNNTLIVQGNHPPIISSEIFEAAQIRRNKLRALYKRSDPQSPVEFMLKGLVKCSSCGASLTMTSSHSHLQCCRYAKGLCSVSHYVSLDSLTSSFIKQLRYDLSNIPCELKIHPRERLPQTNTENMIDHEKKKLLRIRTAYENGVDTLEEYKAMKSKLLSRINELESLRNAVSAEKVHEKKLNLHISFLEENTISETGKNIFLKTIIDKVVYDKFSRSLIVYYKGNNAQ